uniref:Peptidase_M13_N domain-containing protein n=1 Tax=Steinernema glaseri TaxID=37863 RepID=A0A1I7ZQY0_9BILA
MALKKTKNVPPIALLSWWKIAATLVIATAVACFGSWSYVSYMTYVDSSKPCDTNAYVDKALLFHERHLANFNAAIRGWMHNEGIMKGYIDHESGSGKLNQLVDDAQALLKKISESEADEYLKHMSLLQFLATQKLNKSQWETAAALEKHIKSINIDRTFVLEKFFAAYIGHPELVTVATLNKTLAQIDLKVAQLEGLTRPKYHKYIGSFWNELKRTTTPGISKYCLPEDASVEDIVEAYGMMIDVRESKCVPFGEEKYEVDTFCLTIWTIVGWFLMYMFQIVILCEKAEREIALGSKC